MRRQSKPIPQRRYTAPPAWPDLGRHILSDNATGLANAFMLAMSNQIPVEKLYRQSVTTPYPSRESDIIYMLKPLLDRSACS